MEASMKRPVAAVQGSAARAAAARTRLSSSPHAVPAVRSNRSGAALVGSRAAKLTSGPSAFCGKPLVMKGQQSSAAGSRRVPSVTSATATETPADFDDSDDIFSSRDILETIGHHTDFQKIMSANRGEIAVRCFRAGTELGMRTVAVYSAVDRLQSHRYKADESYCVGDMNTPPVRAYLDIEAIIAIAKKNGVDAIHPGYGFLSENSTMARRCEQEGIVFIGPKAETLEAMGDKTSARALAQECGVPVVPGVDEPLKDAAEGMDYAKKFGFPVILKALAGGGGRGMRVVRKEEELEDLFNRASNEALQAFGDGRMFIEKFVEGPRHIEVQVLADNYGNTVHLHERDCSVQRRHQKIVEMAPAFELDAGVRAALHADAVKLAKHVGYRNAGTVEFMVSAEGDYYFLEVNPRIQVEHTVTEEVTSIDLVQSQILIAAGKSLEEIGIPNQDAVQVKGFAIQCRVTSEDPEMNFSPDSGRIEAYRAPGGMGIRLDGSLGAGSYVSPHYDSLLVKVTARASDFHPCVQKLYRALTEFRIRGIKTNIPFVQNVLRHPEFLSGRASTQFVDTTPELFNLGLGGSDRASRLLRYLAEIEVNGANHPGAVGLPPSSIIPVQPELPDGVVIEGEDLSGDVKTLKGILDKDGPEAFAKAVRGHQGLLLTDTTWRDAHQSLLATRMRTNDLARAAPFTAHALAPAFSLEMWGGATFDVTYRFLHECPWARLDKLRELTPNIPFQMLLRGANAVGYTTYADNVVTEFCKQAKQGGIDVFRVFDSLNYLDNLLFGVDAVRDAGGVVEGTICYTGDCSDPSRDKYTVDYYLGLTEKLVDAGIHTLAIKDMAGLLKPKAATMLVGAIRARWPDLPIHVHTHDTPGVGVAAMLAAAEAGADVVDTAIDAMSGLTSQPSMGAIVNAVQGSDLDTGIKSENLFKLDRYWEQTRGLYMPFESSLKAGSSDVYTHEMPGGQYTNLKFQAMSLGLGSQWDQVKNSYAAANRALGDIVKVTPSSKVVGDLAQFMVQNELDENSVVTRAEELSFPSSVVEFMQGLIGQPSNGFPEPLRSGVLKGKPVVDGRPGASLEPVDIDKLKRDLGLKYGENQVGIREVLSYALYPKVYEDYMAMKLQYSDLSVLPTRAFLEPLDVDEEVVIELQTGKQLYVKLKATGELMANGTREVFFELNGVPRVINVIDRTDEESAKTTNMAKKEKADPAVLGSVGAPMSGEVVEVVADAGKMVKAGEPLVVLSAMKMETTVSAPCAGRLQHVGIVKGDAVAAGDLLIIIEEPVKV